jgi:hypothetical protein
MAVIVSPDLERSISEAPGQRKSGRTPRNLGRQGAFKLGFNLQEFRMRSLSLAAIAALALAVAGCQSGGGQSTMADSPANTTDGQVGGAGGAGTEGTDQ